jgi:hypothetical protein
LHKSKYSEIIWFLILFVFSLFVIFSGIYAVISLFYRLMLQVLKWKVIYIGLWSDNLYWLKTWIEFFNISLLVYIQESNQLWYLFMNFSLILIIRESEYRYISKNNVSRHSSFDWMRYIEFIGRPVRIY